MLVVSKWQVANQPYISVVVKVSVMKLSNALPSGSGERSMLAGFGMSADVVVRTDSSSGLVVFTTRTWSLLARADLLLVGAAASTRRRHSHEDGAGRQTSERTTHGKVASVDGIRVQRWPNILGARGAMTMKIVLSSMAFEPEFS